MGNMRTGHAKEQRRGVKGKVLVPADACESERLSDALGILKPTARRNQVDPKPRQLLLSVVESVWRGKGDLWEGPLTPLARGQASGAPKLALQLPHSDVNFGLIAGGWTLHGPGFWLSLFW